MKWSVMSGGGWGEIALCVNIKRDGAKEKSIWGHPPKEQLVIRRPDMYDEW